ncbi:hypothetical protein PHBOTO_006232 [Pseudozyma hubeiensis]|nr:hypothetical protein PHBOTO_006232 [Pseudozyma hubeiensis]
MAKHELFNNEYDTYDELADEDVKSPKKAKKETKVKQSPGSKGGGMTDRREWTKEEDEALFDCLGEIVSAGMAQTVGEFPALSQRNAAGCIKHWVGWRRKLETTLLGAPTVDGNGKKLIKKDIVKPDDTK